jgi:hypothetical protein
MPVFVNHQRVQLAFVQYHIINTIKGDFLSHGKDIFESLYLEHDA